jgi:hypothetical protein
MSGHHEDDQVRALLAPLDTIEPVTRNATRRSPRRLRMTVAAVTCCLITAGVGATAFGAFSGSRERTMANFAACKASTVALTTSSGARVLTGHTDAGIYCVAYENAKGGGGSTTNTFPTPAGDVIPGKTFDGVSNTSVLFGVVPPGYERLSIGSQEIPIKNQAFVIEAKTPASLGPILSTPGTLAGPAGKTTIDLSMFAGP